jgi:PAS domain S-box-containing protein
MPEQEIQVGSIRGLHDFIESSREGIVAAWIARVRTLSPARELSGPALIDHLPQILSRIADGIEAMYSGGRTALADTPREHAIDRLARGFDLDEVIKEYSLLRECILDLWERQVGSTINVSEVRRLDSALDQSIAESTVSFARARERMLRAVDRISEAALGSSGASTLDVFLGKLLQATLETTEAVDSAAVMLREGDSLRMRAAVGLEQSFDPGFTVKIGEGIAGKIAAEAHPVLLRHASTDALVGTHILREMGVRALYGVPLIHGDAVIGVTYMGSRTAFEFSDEDKLLFRTMASRATSVIVQAQLFSDLQRALADRDKLVAQQAQERGRLEQILDQIPAGVLIAAAPDAQIRFANKRCQEILGRPAGRSGAVSNEPPWHPYHFDGRPYRFEETPRARALLGEEVLEEFKIQRPDGRWIRIRAHAAPVRDETGRIQSAVVAFEDVSEQNRDEESLRFLSEVGRQLAGSIEYEKTLSQLARLTVPRWADWFSVELQERGAVRTLVVAHADPAKQELAEELRRRFPPSELGEGGFAKVLRTGEPELFAEIDDQFLVAAAQNQEHLNALRKLGIRSAMVVPLKVRGATIGAITFVMAESGRRYDRRDLEMAQSFGHRAAMALENARLYREAASAVRLREEVLAVVSHDLRNPLGAITLAAAILLKKFSADPRPRKQVETIERSASRMTHLVDDLLDMASIQAGRLAVERTPQELAPILREAVELADPAAAEKGIALRLDLALDGTRCAVDRERLLQVFANLLGNAKKFCPAGSSITVRAERVGDQVECVVADTGPGIPEAERPHIFDPYWSAERHAKKGIGLGLYISKGIVDAHGGHIWVANAPGGGAAFHFRLPLASPAR